MVSPLIVHGTKQALHTAIFDVRLESVEHPQTGHKAEFVVVDSPDWVNVVAQTQEGQLVMVRQYRHGTRTIETEIPAGIVDPGESALDAAARELREETGYAAEHLEIIGTSKPNPAFMTNKCTTVLATNCRRIHEQEFDESEDIEVFLATGAEVRGWLADGTINHCVVMTGLMYWQLQAASA